MLSALLAVVSLVAQQPRPVSGITMSGSSALVLTLAAPVAHADGRVSGGSARGLTRPFTYFVHSTGSLCGPSTVSPAEPRSPAFGWRVTATAISLSASEIIVKIDWQRLWERGQALGDGPRGSTELTLKREDRVPLDRITAPAAEGCDAVGVGLEVWAERRLVWTSAGEGPLARDLDAELWLVHTHPDGTERVQLQTIRSGQAGMGFFFRPASVEADGAKVTVEVLGEIRPTRAPDGTTVLFVAIERAYLSDAPGATRRVGGSGRSIAMPMAGEVISFDMPPAGGRGAGGGGGRGGGTFAGAGRAASGGAAGSGGGGGRGGTAAGPSAGVAAGPAGPDPLAGHAFSVRLRLK